MWTLPMYDYIMDKNKLNDKNYSKQPALGIMTMLDIPAGRPALDDEFRLTLDYKVEVQEQGICRTIECLDNYYYYAKN